MYCFDEIMELASGIMYYSFYRKKQDMNTNRDMSPSFKWLNITQFFGALNDNIFKLLAVFFLIRLAGTHSSSLVVSLTGAVFVVPFLLFTPAAGVLADRFSKRNIIVLCKCLELMVMLGGVFAFMLGQPWMVYAIIFLMATHSALFGPSKYGIIAELVSSENLSRANSFILSATFMAIILGTAGAPLIVSVTGGCFNVAALVCVSIAMAGILAALRIERTPAAGSSARISPLFFKDVWHTLRLIRPDRYLLLAFIGGAYFYLIAAFMQLNLIPYGMEHFKLTDVQSGYLFLVAAVGIGLGSLLAGWVSGRHIEFGLIPVGALGLTVCVIILNGVSRLVPWAGITIFMAGVSIGLFIIPLDAFIQFRSPPDQRGKIMAAYGFLTWVGILLASALLYVLSEVAGLSAAQGFVVIGILTLILTAVTIKVLPDFLARFIALLLTRFCYRIKTVGIEHLPVDGPALLVSNHVSYMDALLILATQHRRIRFVMDRDYYEGHWWSFLFRLSGMIPISMEDPPKKIIRSLRAARAALDDGFMVAIFAEGALTRTGLMSDFKSGLERIVKNSSHPIIPIYIGGIWGSMFSHYYGRPHARLPVQFPYPVTIIFGSAMPSTTSAPEIRQAVMELSCQYFEILKSARRSLAGRFIRSARKNWSCCAMMDTIGTGHNLTYGQALTAAMALAREIGRISKKQDNIGILFPASVAGALTNLAVLLQRKVAVNLNFTVSAEVMDSSIRQAGIKTIISSRAFIRKFPALANLPGLVFFEDIQPLISGASKIIAWLKARFVPACFLGVSRVKADDPATIIFSSGTTGEPKGIMLSHHNVLSNAEAAGMVFRPQSNDCLCGTLPFFHSFGYTCCLFLPLLNGTGVCYHPNPLEGGKVAEIIRENRCTAIFTTPTFLLACMRRAKREDFRTLRLVVVGAEKLKKRTADAFEEQFGIRPLEGYGATELSPVVSLGLPDIEVDGVYQAGSKPGSVGQALPGIAVKIVDPETGQSMPFGQTGLLLVKGPNVMLGYLNRPDLTAEVIRDGWYRTGDVAQMDVDGFITITDRLSRFSKIGGEMVPHLAVEDEYLRGLNTVEPILAVTSIPDEKKGEQLIVLYTKAAGDPARLHSIMEQSSIPNLWKPDRDAYYPVESLPFTGSGKLDVLGLRKLASEQRC